MNSLPKSGTHLLERALCLHPRLYRPILPTISESNVHQRGGLERLLARLRPGQILVSHLWCDPRRVAEIRTAGVVGLLMVRDPRDIVISTAHYAASNPRHPWHRRYLAEPSVSDRIRLTIVGDDEVEPITDLLHGFAEWQRHGFLLVRFEDLVGPPGGGDAVSQLECLRGIYRHIGMPVSEALLGRIQGQLFSSRSPTFRRGAIGEWRSAFDDKTIALFDETATQLLHDLGYGVRAP